MHEVVAPLLPLPVVDGMAIVLVARAAVDVLDAAEITSAIMIRIGIHGAEISGGVVTTATGCVERCLALRDLVLVVREGQIDASGV
eukprot:COSAG01_NODE_190_length_22595_cov_16.442301_24_plen_86_part_00